MRRSNGFIGRTLGAALLVFASAANAQVVGTFNAAGSAVFTGTPANVVLTPSTPLMALPPLSGIFSLVPPFTPGVIQSASIGQGPFAVPNYITLAGFTFGLGQISVGSFPSTQCSAPAAVGQVCSIAGSGFNWSNASDGLGGLNATASFNFSGMVTTPTAQAFNYTGIFTGQFVGLSYQQVLGGLATQGRGASYSLNIQALGTTSVPEPATVVLMAAGLLAIGVFARRRRAAL